MKKLFFVALCAFALVGCGDAEVEDAASVKSSAVESVAESVKSEPVEEAMTAEKFVKEHKRANVDDIISEFNALEDETIKQQLTEQVADSNTTLFGLPVVVTGTAVEWHEGADGMSKGSFIVETDAGNRVRINAKRPNEALDIGEKVEVKNGTLATPINSDDILVREASVYIK
ncbi:MAG: hypothetical protein RR588_05800 [Solibacillus sp.]